MISDSGDQESGNLLPGAWKSAYTNLTAVALAYIAALAEVEYKCHRVVHIAGVVQADYSNHDGELPVVWTADKIGVDELKHRVGEC